VIVDLHRAWEEHHESTQFAGATTAIAEPGGAIMHRFAKWLVVLTMVIHIVPSAAFADWLIDSALIPDDATVAPPSAAVPESYQQFLGAWVGRWSGAVKHILIVESVQSDGSAKVIYAYGVYPGLSFLPGFRRLGAKVSGDTLTIEGSFTATYKLTSATSATASYRRGENRHQADMVKADLAALIASGTKFSESIIMIDTKLQENGKPVRLEVVIDKPPGDGPFPLLVVNHGSTGRGNNPALFTETSSNPVFAAIFVKKGYMVAFPQRRGRGRSEGLYDEGFEVDRTQGYACDPKLSLPGADRALTDIAAAVETLRQRPDVAPQPILMAGVSRGGILSIAYAGMYPREVAGVINFVGGWMGEGCRNAGEINGTLFKRGGMFPHPTLWLYGDHDPFYSLDHSRANFAAFQAADGKGSFFDFEVPGGNGHMVIYFPPLWTDHVDGYLHAIGAEAKQ
jgi:dienelactone hydrolase